MPDHDRSRRLERRPPSSTGRRWECRRLVAVALCSIAVAGCGSGDGPLAPSVEPIDLSGPAHLLEDPLVAALLAALKDEDAERLLEASLARAVAAAGRGDREALAASAREIDRHVRDHRRSIDEGRAARADAVALAAIEVIRLGVDRLLASADGTGAE